MLFKRRDFLKLASTGAVAGLTKAGMASESQHSRGVATAGRDKYGGCNDIQFDAMGFFRLEKANRWWLATPDSQMIF